jgi:hypothetical protein
MAVVVIGAGAFALLHSSQPAPAPITTESAPEPQAAAPAEGDPHGGMDPHAQLPPNHPPVGDTSMPPQMQMAPASDAQPAITWKVPDGWQVATKTSPMRLATYRTPPAQGGTDGAEMSVMRAGGDTDANVKRWAGQFDDSPGPKRTDRTVHGVHVTVVELEGTFRGGGMMMMGAAPAPQPDWAMLAAIAEAPETSYFFKLVGPRAAVKAARSSFDSLVGSIAPKP